MGSTTKEQLLKDLEIGSGRPRTARAPRGTRLHCKGWHQEAALRMLLNNHDPENGEKQNGSLVSDGGREGKPHGSPGPPLLARVR